MRSEEEQKQDYSKMKSQFQIRGSFLPDLEKADFKLNDKVIQMQKVIMLEKQTPDIIPFNYDLFENLKKAVKSQEDILKQENPKDNSDRFIINIHIMELERMKYMLKSYIRTRLSKIEKHMLYIVEEDQASLLSEQEGEFVWNLYETQQNFFREMFYKNLPEKIDKFSEGETDKRLLTKPNLFEFVFARFLKDIPSCQVTESISVEIKQGGIYFMPYDFVK